MNILIHEFRQALRGIATQPGFSLLVIGVMSAGLGCVIYMLIAIGSMVMRPLPFAEPQQLHTIGIDEGDRNQLAPMRSDDLLQLRRQLDATAAVAGFAIATINLSDLDRPERFRGAFVSGNLFSLLGVAPLLGRDFAASDEGDGAAAVVMLSNAVWKSRYAGNPSIVGQSIRVNAQPATVVGVMPEDFSFPQREVVWTVGRLVEGSASDHDYSVVVRRRSTTAAQALDAAVATWSADAAKADPERFRGVHVGVQPLSWMAVNRGTRAVLGVMLAAVILVLLVACANAANLLLTRTLGRRQELAIRVALGAGRARLITHLIAQSLVLTLIAVLVALPLAVAAARWTERSFVASDEGQPLWMHFTLDATIIWMTLGVAVVTALAAGLLPALRAGGAALAGDLRDGSRGATGGGFARVSRVLVIGEVALSCALLIAVGTLVRGIVALDRAEIGIDPSRMLTARIGLFTTTYPTGADQTRVFERFVERLRADPEVIDATATTSLPAVGDSRRDFLPEGEVIGDAPLPQLNFAAVDDRFVETYALRLREGRFFDARDVADGLQVAVVDARFAERHGLAGSVIGQRFRLNPRDAKAPTVTVVGVLDEFRMSEPGSDVRPSLLVPMRQQPERFASLAVRVHGDPDAFAPRLSTLIREVDADTPAYWVRSYAQALRQITFSERLIAKVFAAFGVIALLLAGAGLYGVMAFNVAQRTREIGVRRALGAPASSVLRDVALRAAWQLGIGLVLGLGLGIPFARILASSLDSIASGDAVVVIGALLVLVIAAVFAIAIPVRRALRVDPMIALRHE